MTAMPPALKSTVAPVLRVMVEGENEAKVGEAAAEIAEAVEEAAKGA